MIMVKCMIRLAMVCSTLAVWSALDSAMAAPPAREETVTIASKDGEVVGDKVFCDKKRPPDVKLNLSKWNRADLEACRFTKWSTIFRAKNDDVCFMVMHWHMSGEDCCKGVNRIVFKDGSSYRMSQTRDLDFHKGQPDAPDQFDRDGWEYLPRFKSLQTLYLEGDEASDEHLELVAGLSSLKSLELRKQKYSLDSIEKLKLALPKCQVKLLK